MSVRTLSSTIINKSTCEDGKTTKESSNNGYLSLISHIKSKKAIEKPLSEYTPSRYNEGAYWRRTKSICDKCYVKDCPCLYSYDDEDEEYQKYIMKAVENSLETYCDQEMSKQLCQMIVSSPQKPSRKGQYELSRSYQLTKDDPDSPIIFNQLKRNIHTQSEPSKRVKRDISTSSF